MHATCNLGVGPWGMGRNLPAIKRYVENAQNLEAVGVSVERSSSYLNLLDGDIVIMMNGLFWCSVVISI